jgi:hypothetical protein
MNKWYEGKDKLNACADYIEMTRNSWTWDRMTEDERENCLYALEWANNHSLFGNYPQRWNILHGVYTAFLAGLGYTHDPNWRA